MIGNDQYRALIAASMILDRGELIEYMPTAEQPHAQVPPDRLAVLGAELKAAYDTVRAGTLTTAQWMEARPLFTTFVAFTGFRQRVTEGSMPRAGTAEIVIRRVWGAHAMTLARNLATVEQTPQQTLIALLPHPPTPPPAWLAMSRVHDVPADTPGIGEAARQMQLLGHDLVTSDDYRADWGATYGALYAVGQRYRVPDDTSYPDPALILTQATAPAFVAEVEAALAASGDTIHAVDFLLWTGMRRSAPVGGDTRVMNVLRVAMLGLPPVPQGEAPGDTPATPPPDPVPPLDTYDPGLPPGGLVPIRPIWRRRPATPPPGGAVGTISAALPGWLVVGLAGAALVALTANRS